MRCFETRRFRYTKAGQGDGLVSSRNRERSANASLAEMPMINMSIN